jgi:pyrroloquinoline quinone biosynthesis protein D
MTARRLGDRGPSLPARSQPDRPRLSRYALLRRDPEDDGWLVVLPERAVKLSDSAKQILDLCDGQRTRLEVAQTIEQDHPGVSSARDDTLGFVTEMQQLGVLDAAPERGGDR